MPRNGTYGGHLEFNAATRIFNIFFILFDSHTGNITEVGINTRGKILVNLLHEGDENGGH
jgi:hypothetical protein